MKLERDDVSGWRARQGIRWGEGATRLGAMLDCVVACAEVLSLGLARAWRVLRQELGQWWWDVFLAGDE